MKYRHTVRILLDNGFKLKRQRGSHRSYEGFAGGRRRLVTISGHDGDDVRSKNLASIIRQSGLATGQRRDEVAFMKWSDIDPDTQVWTLPRETTKSDRLHEIPLSPLALEILNAVPRTGEFVFTTTGHSPVSGFSKAKKRCDQLSGLKDWRIHDLRRTAASGMARLGIAPHVVEKVLNHATGGISGVAAVYNRYGYAEEKRVALATWSRALENLVRGPEPNVVELRA